MKLAALLALTVAAASSTRPVLEKRREAIERAAGEPVVFVYAATGVLARQLENGAPFDVFLAADAETPALLARSGLLDAATVRPYARGRLVLAAEPVSKLALPKVLDRAAARALFARPFRRLAIASPRVAPYGRAAIQALSRAGVLDGVRERLVEAENVEQAREFVSSGNADLGFLAAPTVPRSLPSVAVAPELYDPIVYSGGLVARSRSRAAALRALDALTTAESRAVLEQLGYSVP
ncbi:MAG TPA: molybdate ABC transporter substrate-binding protein [Thermoanaerobaculia bacterium]|nr:molybdate ABC transporter substrate-binding protein [Thermoanaerobaculia bacterium]